MSAVSLPDEATRSTEIGTPDCVAAAQARKSDSRLITSADAPADCVTPGRRSTSASVAGSGGRYVADALAVLSAVAPAGRCDWLMDALPAGVKEALPLREPEMEADAEAPSLSVAVALCVGV